MTLVNQLAKLSKIMLILRALKIKLFHDDAVTLLIPQGVDLAYLQTGIRGVFFWVLNFENLYFWVLATAAAFFGSLNKCRIFLGC